MGEDGPDKWDGSEEIGSEGAVERGELSLTAGQERACEVFLPLTMVWEAGDGRELPNQVYKKPS